MSLQINEQRLQDLQDMINSIDREVKNGEKILEKNKTEIPKKIQEIDERYASLDEESKLNLKQLFGQMKGPELNPEEAAKIKQKTEDYLKYLESYDKQYSGDNPTEDYNQGKSR